MSTGTYMTVLRAGVFQALIRVHAQCPFSGTGSATLLPRTGTWPRTACPKRAPHFQAVCAWGLAPHQGETLPEVNQSGFFQVEAACVASKSFSETHLRPVDIHAHVSPRLFFSATQSRVAVLASCVCCIKLPHNSYN